MFFRASFVDNSRGLGDVLRASSGALILKQRTAQAADVIDVVLVPGKRVPFLKAKQP